MAEAARCKVEWNEKNQYIKIAPNETYVTNFKELNAILNMRQFRWGGAGFGQEYSKILNNIRINTGDKFEEGLNDLLKNDMEGCYYCGIFLIDEDYLYGNSPLPQVALKVYDIGLSLPVKNDEDKYTKISLSVMAAVANKKYGDEEKAKRLKAQVEEMLKQNQDLVGGFPALTDEDRNIYESL